jgi:hypothetical protein
MYSMKTNRDIQGNFKSAGLALRASGLSRRMGGLSFPSVHARSVKQVVMLVVTSDFFPVACCS